MSDLYPVVNPVQGISSGLFPKHVSAKLFKQYIQLFPLINFMGMEETRPIAIHRMKRGEGWAYTVGKLNAMDYTKPVLNFDQVSGTAKDITIDEFTVQCRKQAFLREIKGRDLLELGTPVDLPATVRPQLIEACQRNLLKSLLDTAMFDWLSPLGHGGYDINTQLPSYDRVVMGGVNNGGTAAQDGADRTAYYNKANLKTAWNSLPTGAAFNEGGLSAKHLLKLKAIATSGGYSGGATYVNGDIEDKLRPAYMKSYKGAPINEYIYFCTTDSIAKLYEDPMFFQSTVARGTVISPDQPDIITGGTYHGKFNGIHIYEVEELSRYMSFSQTGDKKVAWELFIGAGAWTLGWFKEPWITLRDNPTDSIQEYTSHEIRGQETIKFKAKQPTALAYNANMLVEQGIIHSFVRV